MELLKHSTREQHAAIERGLNVQRPDFSRASYCALLRKFYGYYSPWERLCGPLIDEVKAGFMAPRRKSPLMEKDLIFLGGGIVGTYSECADLPVLATSAQAIGSMYVIEGSTLGGRVLAQHFSVALAIGPETGGCFFAAYGAQTGVMWREFAAQADASITSEHAPEAVEAAISTFETLHRWLVSG
jgi:heme oxygenase